MKDRMVTYYHTHCQQCGNKLDVPSTYKGRYPTHPWCRQAFFNAHLQERVDSAIQAVRPSTGRITLGFLLKSKTH